ncbi:MAG: lipid II flippase MurJ [Bdellovibrionales bacterium]
MKTIQHSNIVKLLLSVSVVGLLAGLITTARDIYLARSFGATEQMDTFFILLVIPMFLISITNSTLNSTLVPLLSKETLNRISIKVSRLSSLLALIALIFMATLVYASIPIGHFFNFWLPHLDEFDLSFACFTLMVPLAVYSTVLRSALNAKQEVFKPALSQIIIAFSSIASLIGLHQFYGIEALSIGLFLGYTLELVYIQKLYFNEGLKIHLSAIMFNKEDIRFYKNSFFLLLAAVLMYMTLVVDQFMATSLENGDVSNLVYAGKPINFILLILAGGISQVFLPEFTIS